MSKIDSKSYVTLTDANADGKQPVPHPWQERTNTAMTTQFEQVEVQPRVTATAPELQDPVDANVARLLLLALDDFDRLLANSMCLPGPDHEGWRLSLYPWIEDLARAREHVTDALSCLGVQPIRAVGRQQEVLHVQEHSRSG